MMYRGIGNQWRELSQLKLMVRLRNQYGIRSVLNAPYDHATDPEVDNQPFKKWAALQFCSFAPNYGVNGFDLVWNFDFVQRNPSLLEGMIQLSKRYVLAFVPNRYNAGQVFHGLYHRLHGNICMHPEGGQFELMTRRGLETLFQEHGLQVIESGHVDMPMWFDYVVGVMSFFRTPNTGKPESIYDNTPRIPLPKQLLTFEELINPLAFTWGHHCYCLGEKQNG